MLLNYLKLSLRLLARNPLTTLIHVGGLTVGFVTFLLLWPYAEYELRSDQFRQDADKIVRLGADFKWTDDGQNWNGMLAVFNSWGVAREVANTFPNIDDVTRIVPQLNFNKKLHGFENHFFISTIDRAENKKTYRETRVILADPNLFQFFSIPLVVGDAQQVLNAPNTIVLSETTSKKYFGEENALGKTVYVNDSVALKVTGVYKDLPQNSHLRFDMVISVAGKTGVDIPVWNGWNGYCYMKLKKGYDFDLFQRDLNDRKATLYGFVKYGCPHCDWSSLVQPLKEIVFTDLRGNTFATKSKFLLEAVYVVSFVVLILGWINYITLSIHSINKRLPEWATRKVVGARKRDLLIQLFVDSVVINTLSLAAAITIFQLVKNPAEQLLGLYILNWEELSPSAVIVIALTFLASIMVTTLCPILVIYKKGIIELLKGKGKRSKPSYLNLSLVTTQYVIAIVLLIWIVITSLQLKYILEKDVGIKKNGVLVIEGPARGRDYSGSEISSFLTKVNKINGVLESTVSHSLIGEPDVKGITVYRQGGGNYVGTDTNGGVDENFLNTFEIKLLAGRNFLPDNPADENTVLISEALTKRLGFSSLEEAIGQKISLPDGGVESAEVIGVFSDYQFRPYLNDRSEHGRGVLLTYKNFLIPFFRPAKISVSLDMDKFTSVLPQIESLQKSLFPSESLKWYWLDEKLSSQYNNEKVAKNQISFFTFLAVGIACLGLLGIISNVAAEKTKEIGIRKVLGAQLHQVGHVLLRTIFNQIVLATLIGVPAAYYLVQMYLEKFTEQIHMQWWHFALPVVILLAIMFSTIAAVVWKAATRNPVEALKYE